MDWEEAMSEARRELGYCEDEYIEDFQGLVDEAKDILEYNREEEYQNFCVDSYNKHQEYLKSDRWKKLRLEVLSRDNFMCQDCKEKARDVHHMDYNYLGTIKEIYFCISLCRNCHKNRHNIKNEFICKRCKESFTDNYNHSYCNTCEYLIYKENQKIDNFNGYICKKCEHKFCSDDDIPYCTACNCEDLQGYDLEAGDTDGIK